MCIITENKSSDWSQTEANRASSPGSNYASLDDERKDITKPARNTQPQQQQTGKANFFETLQWQDPGGSSARRDSSSDDEDNHRKPEKRDTALFQIGDSFDTDFSNFSAERVSGPADDDGPSNSRIPGFKTAEQIIESSERSGNLFDASFSPTDEEPTRQAAVATADLLDASGWANPEQNDLFDLGPPEPTNLDLLGGGGTSSVPHGGKTTSSSSSAADLLAGNEPLFSTLSSAETNDQPNNNPFEAESLISDTTTSPLSNMAADLFGTFDPFADVTGGAKTTPPAAAAKNEASTNDDFMEFIGSKSSSSSAAATAAGTGSMSSDFDLLGNWNSKNVASGVGVNMSRVQPEITRNSSSQSMTSNLSASSLNGRQNVAPTNGNATQRADPFADLGKYPMH